MRKSIKNLDIHNSLAVGSAVNKLKTLYSYYHKLATCYKRKYKKLKKQKVALNTPFIALTVVGSALVPLTHHKFIHYRSWCNYPRVYY